MKMPGKIMTAQQAAKIYGSTYRSIKKRGNTVSLRNSDGRSISVSKNTKVYHRGKGRFGVYSAARDAKRLSRGATNLSKPVGTGAYRHTSDYSRKKR